MGRLTHSYPSSNHDYGYYADLETGICAYCNGGPEDHEGYQAVEYPAAVAS